ncbi:MAG: transporter substrate-binding domain-containing protein, partial [Spirochaetota bacterium]
MLFLSVCAPSSAKGPSRSRIIVVLDDNYPPYIFRDSQGNIQGILVDQWKRWEDLTGITADLRPMDWSAALRCMKNGRADVIDTVFFNEERAAYLDFTKPYAAIDVPVFFNKNISGITDIASLRGYEIGVKSGDAAIGVLRSSGIDTLREYRNYEEIVSAAGESTIKVFCVDRPPALYYLYKMKLDDEFRYGLSLYSGKFHRAVLKGNSELLQTVERGFDSIPEDEYDKINRKWMGAPLRSYINPAYLVYGSIAVLIILLNLGYISFVLRRKVLRKTAQLRSSIEELKEKEHQLNAYIAAIPDLIFIIHESGTFIDYNSPTAEMLAVQPELFVGKNIEDLSFSEDFKKKSREIILHTLSTGIIQTFMYDIATQAGTKFYEARVVPYNKDTVLWISRDVSESRHKDEQLVRAQKMETIGNLAGGLAHDFNNILCGIIGTTSLLKYRIVNGSVDPDSFLEDIGMIEDTAKRGADIVTQLLSVTRRRDLVFDVVDLYDLIEQVLKICRNTFDKSVEIRFCASGGPAYVNAD